MNDIMSVMQVCYFINVNLWFIFNFSVINPSNNKPIGSVPDFGVEDATAAVEAAHSAFQKWKSTTAKVGDTCH